MEGLRERQKADRQRRILDAATELFREVGYERTNIDIIAQHAEVSIGTIYNYYKNKGDLLLAIVSMEVHEVLKAGERIIEAPPGDPYRAVARLISNYLKHSLVYLTKEMWRQAMAISTQQPDSRFGRAYAELDEKLSNQVCRLIEHIASSGHLVRDVNAAHAGELIFNNTNMMFILFVKSEQMNLAVLMERIALQNAVLLDALISEHR